MKLTRFCLLPWRFMQIHAGGMMQCCAVAPDMDEGDFLLDYCEHPDHEKPFDNEGLQLLRHGLLTGNLRPMCRNCFFVPNEKITTEEFRKRLIDYLSSRKPNVDFNHQDLTKVHAYNWMAISFTNRCNLSCIYCVQSVMKDKNPYFKMDFPYEYAQKTLDLFVEEGIDKLSTCVEGEATLYPHWYELIVKFHQDHPNIFLAMTTNLNRRYTEEEIDLLSQYNELDVSIDSIDPEIYSYLRRNGRLEVLLENVEAVLQRVKETGRKGPHILFHIVLSDKSWPGLEKLADYALERNISLNIGNYEVRPNTIATQQNLLKPVSMLPHDVQEEVYRMIKRVRVKADGKDCTSVPQGDVATKLEKQIQYNYNEWEPHDNRILIQKFYEQFPNGSEGVHLATAYDTDNISHEGIYVKRGETLRVENIPLVSVLIRPIEIYKPGTVSDRYQQTVKLGYKKKVSIKDGVFEYTPSYGSENIETIVLEVL